MCAYRGDCVPGRVCGGSSSPSLQPPAAGSSPPSCSPPYCSTSPAGGSLSTAALQREDKLVHIAAHRRHHHQQQRSESVTPSSNLAELQLFLFLMRFELREASTLAAANLFEPSGRSMKSVTVLFLQWQHFKADLIQSIATLTHLKLCYGLK